MGFNSGFKGLNHFRNILYRDASGTFMADASNCQMASLNGRLGAYKRPNTTPLSYEETPLGADEI